MFGNRGFSPYSSYGLGVAAKSGINWSSLLSNTQKTLGIINQAIPAFYQIKPIFSNMKTMFRVMNEINKDDQPRTNNNTQVNTQNNQSSFDENVTSNTTYSYESENRYSKFQDDGPSFFV